MKNTVSSKPEVRSCDPRGFTATLKVGGNEAEQQKDGPAVPGAGTGAAGGRLSRLRAQADRGPLPPWLALSDLIFSAPLTLCQGRLFGSVSLITLKLSLCPCQHKAALGHQTSTSQLHGYTFQRKNKESYFQVFSLLRSSSNRAECTRNGRGVLSLGVDD